MSDKVDYLADQRLVGDERAQLEAFLDDNRTAVVRLLDGLTEQEVRASLVPSLTTLLGLVKHVAFVERVWFQVSLLGRTREELGLPDNIDDSFRISDEDTIPGILADFQVACAASRQAAAAYGLDELARHNRRGPLTLRWVYVHMIEELARHAGHGDILREQLLAERTSSG